MAVHSVLVTGGSGFLGSRIVQHIHEKFPQCAITVLDKYAPAADKTYPNVRYIQADVTSLSSATDAVTAVRPQAVVHSAGLVPPLADRYSRRIEEQVMAINVEGTRNMLQAARSAGVRAFVFTSSCCAVTDDFREPLANIDERWFLVEPGTATIYGESKAKAEMLVHAANHVDDKGDHSFVTCCLRPAVTFGEGDHQLIPSFVSLIIDKKESPFRLGDGMNLWDTVYSGNVADAHVLALENLLSDNPTAAGESFFIQNNEPIGLRDLMLFVWKEFNGHIPPFEVEIPVTLGWVAGIISEACTWITGKPATLSRGSILDAIAMRYASGEKAKRILGYQPRVGLEEGLKRSCREYAQRLQNRAATDVSPKQ